MTMTLLSLKDLAVTLGTPLFSGLNFTIAKEDRIGLVAANGRGKSTLLRALAGIVDPTSGDLTRSRGLKIGLVGQDLPSGAEGKGLRDFVLGALAQEVADSESWRADIALSDLDVPPEHYEKNMRALSGGWQRAGLLARAWVGEPDLLLMDEPTNHLDLQRIGFLQKWLLTIARGVPFILVSHDRAFLDAVTNKTLFLRETGSRLFALPYSAAREALALSDEADARRFGNDMKQAQQLRRQAAKLKNIGVNSGSDLLVVKTKQLKERAEKLEQAAKPAFMARSAGKIELASAATHAKALVALDSVSVSTPDGRLLYKTGALWINKGDRIALLGENGSGKTMLFAMLKRAIICGDVTGIKAAPCITPGFSDQDLSQLDTYPTPFAAISQRFDVGDQRAKSLLAGAGISINLQGARMQSLSGGQKARLAMLVLRLTQPSFYLLDEPTNHLDIEGQEALESELIDSEATCLIVSHDRTFVRNAGTRFWVIKGRKLVEADGPDGFFAEMAG
jgi:ATPase subunit of ABC transporter with duplicated ATPase domains